MKEEEEVETEDSVQEEIPEVVFKKSIALSIKS